MKSRKDCWQELIEGKTLVNTEHVTVKMLPDGSLDKNISFMHPEDWSVKEEPEQLLQLFEGLDSIGAVIYTRANGDYYHFESTQFHGVSDTDRKINIANRIPNGRTCFVNIKTGEIVKWGEE